MFFKNPEAAAKKNVKRQVADQPIVNGRVGRPQERQSNLII